ncbi:hypothetical protein RSOLAG1IB_01685 [Rhizoctonia solani AG-1 IB]|uniref:Uncharacterized protein n=1 Tax=Thanatephorus cucumeris (strain AG1-IB / isolate 7/3/14) TaxID=1108050 RepID=A0A0B7FHI8_THACB|nr:hypothetical protein RSOLAG1IB_01685 [Rhizoctonia solani AG-1 IB]
MCITRTCLGTISTFLSLVTALEGPEDANYFILNPPITTRQSSTATEFEINAHATIGTLNIVYPEVCSSGYQSQPCDIQAVFSLAEWHILGMAITAIFLVWYARKLLDCTETGVYRATYRAGRSEAVSKATESPPAPIGESSPQGDNTSLPRGRQPATAVSSEVTTRHRFPPCWAVDPPIPLVKELESQLNNSATTDSHGKELWYIKGQ